jgi:trk system potassium uptake protein TrkA
MKKFAIIGLSSFGINVVKTLATKDAEIIAIDKDENKVNEVKDIVSQAITMDATSKENMLSVGITHMDHVIVSAGPLLEPSILIVHHLKEMGVERIIAKALSEDHEKILNLVGATEVSFPERDVAVKIGKRLTMSNLLDYLPLESGFILQEIAHPDEFIGKSLAEIHLRKKYNVTVIAIKSIIPESTILNPGGEFVVKESDILITFGSADDIDKFQSKISH